MLSIQKSLLARRVLGVAIALALLVSAPAAAAPRAITIGTWSWPGGVGQGGLSFAGFVLLLDGADLYVGGSYSNAGGDADCDNICKWDGSTWSWPTTGISSGFVVALIQDGSGNLYVAGDFTNGGGVADCDRICLWNETTDTWSWPSGKGMDAAVRALAFDGSGNLYVGGSFVDGGDGAGGNDDDCDRICLWNEGTDTWSWPAGAGLSGDLLMLLYDGSGNVYASGSFVDAGGDADCDGICLWNGASWSWPSASGLTNVYSLLLDGSDLYVGGAFTNGGGDADCDSICLWNGASWSWPSGMGLNNTVHDLKLAASGELFVSGTFLDAGGDTDADGISVWQGSSWIDWPAGQGLSTSVWDMAFDGVGNLYATGTFTDGGGDPDADSIAYMVFPSGLLFEDGFESGDFTAWSGFNDGSGNLTVDTPCAMTGTYGLCAVSTNNKRKQVIDSVPDDETRYYASFQFDHNNITISGASNRIRIFQGRMDTNFPFIVLLRYTGGGLRQLSLRMQTDAGPGNFVDSAWYTISDATHTIGVDWKQSSGSNDGWGDLYVDGTLQGSGHTVDSVDNDTLVIRGTRLGITSRMDGVTMTGTLYFDDFYSDNDGYPE